MINIDNWDSWNNILGVLAVIVVLSMILERAAAQLFESTAWRKLKEKRPGLVSNSLVSFLLAWAMCAVLEFDALNGIGTIIETIDKTKFQAVSFGVIVTAAVIGGGSKGSMLLFQGVLGFGRDSIEASIMQKARIAGMAAPAPTPAPTSPPTT